MHYGLLFEIGKNYSFDKHWHYDFDVTKCPPWDLTDPKRRKHGIFPAPPRPSSLPKVGGPTGLCMARLPALLLSCSLAAVPSPALARALSRPRQRQPASWRW